MKTPKDFNGYTLTKFASAVMDQEKEMKLSHLGLYTYLVELNNRLRWSDTFGIPREHTMQKCHIGRDLYYRLLNDLESFGLITIIEKGKNQNEAAIITLRTLKLATFMEPRCTQNKYSDA